MFTVYILCLKVKYTCILFFGTNMYLYAHLKSMYTQSLVQKVCIHILVKKHACALLFFFLLKRSTHMAFQKSIVERNHTILGIQ
jgi:hypothetical protein